MCFDFDDRYRDIEPVRSAINRRDGVAGDRGPRGDAGAADFAPQ
jgi:hypothetical protein